MKAPVLTPVVAVMIAVVAIGIAGGEYHACETSTARLRSLAEERGNLRHKIADAEIRLLARSPKNSERAAIDHGPLMAGPTPNLSSDGLPILRIWKGLDPAQQLDVGYARFFKRLGFAPEKLERLKRLMIEQREEERDALNAAYQGNDPGSASSESESIMSAAVAPIDREIQSLLGNSDYGQLLEFERTLPKQAIADQLQEVLTPSAMALAGDQRDKLVQALAHNSPVRQELGPPVSLVGPLFPVGFQRISDQDIAQAATVLTDQQLRTLKFLRQLQPPQDNP